MKTIIDYLAPRKKAVAAFLAPIVVVAVAALGFNVDVNVVATVLVSLITAMTVHAVPNKVA